MRSPLQKIRTGVMALGLIFVSGVFAFHFLAGYEWVDALWMVVITISTVGYGEVSDSTPITKLLSIALILLGVTAGAYTFGGMIQIILHGELDQALGKRRMENELKRLSDHTIVCGFSRSGQVLAGQLAGMNHDFVVIENDSGRAAASREEGYLTLEDDATEEDCLTLAKIQSAGAIVIALPTDAENVFITLTARNMCPDIRIISQAERESSRKKLSQAGANEIVLAHRMVAQHMARLITRPSTASLFNLLLESTSLDFELDELIIPSSNQLIGNSIADLAIRDKYHLLVIAVITHDNDLNFNPDGNRCFAAGETMLLLGNASDIDRFRRDYQLLI